jgi:hypothetical protein
MTIKKIVKRVLVPLLLLYLVFDIRPFLLIPNLIMRRKPCGRFANSEGSMEINVYPRLCVGTDPIKAAIRSKGLPLGNAFDRSYDRSRIFHEFQFAGTVNGDRPVDTFYNILGISGGLSGTSHSEKKIWLKDYVRFNRIGLYRINLRYVDTASLRTPEKIDYDLGDFSIIRFPENPVSKLLKQLVLSARLLLPSDDARATTVKLLGYQETTFSTRARAKCYYWGEDSRRSSGGRSPYSDSLAGAYSGILRKYNFRSVGNALKGHESETDKSLLSNYLYLHFHRLVYSTEQTAGARSVEEAQRSMARLIKYTYVHLNDADRKDFRESVMRDREFNTDAFWQARIERCEEEISLATNLNRRVSLEEKKKWTIKRYEEKEKRRIPLQLIDHTIQLLNEEDRKGT